MGPNQRSTAPAGEGGGWMDEPADDRFDPVGAGVLRGGRVIASLDLHRGLREGADVSPDSLVLTDSHVAHLDGTGRRMTSSVIAVRDVSAATVESDRRGPGEYVWGVLAILLGLILWRIVGHPLGSVVAGAVVAALGVYLIAEKVLMPLTSVVFVLSERGTRLRCPLRGKEARADAYDFIARIYERKAQIERADRPGPGAGARSRGRYANRVFRGG